MNQRITQLLFIIVLISYSFWLLRPPAAEPETAPAERYSAERAFDHIQQIARHPHPLGSAAGDTVKTYIFEALQDMGLQPLYQEGIGVRKQSGLAAYTENIIAKMKGSDPQRTILLMAHYDSVPNALGAGDDGSGVAAILETLRALRARKQPLKNNVWVLFTDGEERGLLGAELFIDQFPRWEQIDLVLNLEARGSRGPSMMFETSSANAKLIPHFARAAAHPVANSLMYTVYKLLPNDTDLSVMKKAGLQGLNFAFVEDYLNYHTMQDTPQNLSLSSLQHHGSNILSILEYFGSRAFDLESETDYVYFNNATGGLTYYPANWSLPIAGATSFLFIAFLIYLFRTRQLTFASYLGSLALFLGILMAAALLTFYFWEFIKRLQPDYQWLVQGETYNHSWYLCGFILLSISLYGAVYSWMQMRMSPAKVLAGGYTVWTVLALGTSWLLPTAGYLFTWPVLLALMGWMILGRKIVDTTWKASGILLISLSGVLFMIPPYIHNVQVILTTEMLPICILLCILVLGLIWPLLWKIFHPKTGWWVAGLALFGAACLTAVSVSFNFDSNHKKQNNMSYWLNLNSTEAFWISQDPKPDSWTRQFLGDDFKQGDLAALEMFRSHNLLLQQAPTQEILPPRFEILSDSASDSLRYLSVRLHSRQEGHTLGVAWEQTDGVTGISFFGKAVYERAGPNENLPGSPNRVYLFRDLSEPILMNITYKRAVVRCNLDLTFYRNGLPTHLIQNYKARSADMMPSPSIISDATLWHLTVDLNAVADDPYSSAQ